MEHLPPWLRNLPLPPRPASAASAADAVPAWLRDIEGAPTTPPPSAAAAPPDWLPAAEAAPAGGAAADDVPDWLRDLQGELASTAELTAPEPAASDEEVPDWLREIAAEPAPKPEPQAARPERPAPPGATSWLKGLASDTPPADESAPPPAEPTTTTSRIRMPVGATDWLRSIGQETESSAQESADEPSEPEPPADTGESGVPDWLRDVTPEELASAVAADVPDYEDDQLDQVAGPNWLADLAAEARPVDEDSISGAVPDWLADLTPAGTDAAPNPPRGDVGVPNWLTAAADADEDEAAPDWLRNLAGDAAEPPPSSTPSAAPKRTPVDDVPAWLRDAEEPPAASLAPAANADDVPAWLRGAEDDVVAPAAGADDVPAWLRGAEDDVVAPAANADDVPAWLRDAKEPPAASPAPAAGADDVPAWLRESEDEVVGPPAGADEVPTWLRDIAEPTDTPPATGAEASRPAEPADADVPTWLRDAMSEEADREARQPGSAAQADIPNWLSDELGGADEPPLRAAAPADLNLPSWLRGVADEPDPTPPPPVRPVRAAAEPTRRPPAPDDAEGDDFLRGAELPSWLRMSEPERPTETAEGQALDWLTRLGSSETDEQEDVAPDVAIVPQRRIYQRSSEQLEAVDLLSRLVHAPYPTPGALPEPQPRTRWQQIGIDRILYVVLILALLGGLLVPGLSTPFQTATPDAPGAAELRELIGGLDSEQVVLVAYEWAAQRSSELRPLEDAVTERLVDQQAKLIIVSTDLQGTLLSFDRIEPLREAGYNAAGGGTDYVLLGYRPGGELALRSLARDLRGELARDFNGNDATGSLVATNLDGSPRVSSIRDLALIVVMADQPQDVQAWMEQVHRVAPTVPIAFVLPQETQPLVQPYLRLPNVHHIAGLQGALALRVGGATDPMQIAQATGQHNFAIVIFVVLLIGGAASVAIGRARRAREN